MKLPTPPSFGNNTHAPPTSFLASFSRRFTTLYSNDAQTVPQPFSRVILERSASMQAFHETRGRKPSNVPAHKNRSSARNPSSLGGGPPGATASHCEKFAKLHATRLSTNSNPSPRRFSSSSRITAEQEPRRESPAALRHDPDDSEQIRCSIPRAIGVPDLERESAASGNEIGRGEGRRDAGRRRKKKVRDGEVTGEGRGSAPCPAVVLCSRAARGSGGNRGKFCARACGPLWAGVAGKRKLKPRESIVGCVTGGLFLQPSFLSSFSLLSPPDRRGLVYNIEIYGARRTGASR